MDQSADSIVEHRLQQPEQRVQVVAVVRKGLVDGLRHGLVGRKMHNFGDRMPSKDPANRIAVTQVGLNEGDLRCGERPYRIHRARRRIDEVVDYHDVTARLTESNRCVGADVPSSASDQNSHVSRSSGSSIRQQADRHRHAARRRGSTCQ